MPVGAGHEGGGRAGQEDGDLGDLVGLGQAAHGVAGQGALPGLDPALGFPRIAMLRGRRPCFRFFGALGRGGSYAILGAEGAGEAAMGFSLYPDDLIDDLKRAFKRFSRLSARPTAGEPATGLGLSIVRAIAERHGGAVTARSAPGEETVFEIRLPLVPEAVAEPPAEEPGRAAHIRWNMCGRRIWMSSANCKTHRAAASSS